MITYVIIRNIKYMLNIKSNINYRKYKVNLNLAVHCRLCNEQPSLKSKGPAVQFYKGFLLK